MTVCLQMYPYFLGKITKLFHFTGCLSLTVTFKNQILFFSQSNTAISLSKIYPSLNKADFTIERFMNY